MSAFSKFKPDFKVGHQRYFIDGNYTLKDYLKCDGSIVQQNTYPELFQKIGKIADSGQIIKASVLPTIFVSASAYGNGLYAIGGSNAYGGDYYYTSTDCFNWNNTYTGLNSSIYTLLYANNRWVAGTDGGGASNSQMRTSTNAINWSVTTTISNNKVRTTSYGRGLYIYGGDGGVLGTSTNATNWTARTSNTASRINSIIYSNGLFVYATNGGGLGSSTNGVNWTSRTSGTTYNIVSLTYGNGLYVYGADWAIYGTSTNAINWTSSTIASATSNSIDIVFSGSRFVYAGANGVMGFSTNASNWEVINSTTTYDITTINTDNNGYFFHTIYYFGGVVFLSNVHIYSVYSYNRDTEFALPTSLDIVGNKNPTPFAYIKVR